MRIDAAIKGNLPEFMKKQVAAAEAAVTGGVRDVAENVKAEFARASRRRWPRYSHEQNVENRFVSEGQEIAFHNGRCLSRYAGGYPALLVKAR